MHAIPSVLAFAGGSFIFLGAIALFFFAIVFGYYTFTGSGIGTHPTDGRGEAPGSAGPSQASGEGRTPGERENPASGDTFSTHGTG